MTLDELRKAVHRAAEPPALKPGDTVDPRTLPVGAEFGNSSHRYRVTAPGMCCCINAPGTEGPILSYLSTLISLPQPIADEVVELLGDVIGSWFEFDPAEQALTSNDRRRQQALKLQGREVITNLGYTYFATRKVRRVPAPTAQPETVTGSEPKPSLLSQFVNVAPDCFSCGNACEARFAIPVDGQHYGLCKGCQNLYKAGHKDAIKKRVRERLTPQPEPEPRWQTRDPARIAALEAKLADQVAHGGQGGKSARWLLERADKLAREEQARQHPLTGNDLVGRGRAAYPPQPYLQPGAILNRRDYRPRPRRK